MKPFHLTDPRPAEAYHGTLCRHGLPPADFNPNDLAGGAVVCMLSNWQDAGCGCALPPLVSQQLHISVEMAIEAAGLRPADGENGYAQDNFHLVSLGPDVAPAEQNMGVDSTTGRVYDGHGQQVGQLTQDAPLSEQLAAIWAALPPYDESAQPHFGG